MKSSIFWDITPCSPLKVNRRFGGTCRLHLQSRRISRTRNQRESRWQARWKRHVPPKRRLTFKQIHGVISQKIKLFNSSFSSFMEPDSSLLCTQNPTTGLYLEPNNSEARLLIPFLFSIVLPCGGRVPFRLPKQNSVCTYYVSCVLQIPPVSSLIVSPNTV
jgi:hypothetical protein